MNRDPTTALLSVRTEVGSTDLLQMTAAVPPVRARDRVGLKMCNIDAARRYPKPKGRKNHLRGYLHDMLGARCTKTVTASFLSTDTASMFDSFSTDGGDAHHVALNLVDDVDNDHDAENPQRTQVAPMGGETSSLGENDDESLIRSFRSLVKTSDRGWKDLIKYRRVFVGSEAVDALVSGGKAASRMDAVLLARKLEDGHDIFEHVTNAHAFGDDSSFYRFITQDGSPTKESDGEGDCESESSVSSTEETPFERKFSTFCSPWGLVSHLVTTVTEDMILQTIKTVEVRDRRHNLRTYKACFVGRDLVSLLVARGCCKTREEAVLVGYVLGEEHDLFEHVDKVRDLEDKHIFYRFKQQQPPSAQKPSLMKKKSMASVAASETCDVCAKPRASDVGLRSSCKVQKEDVPQVWSEIFRHVEVRDRSRGLHTHRRCFVGSELIDLLVMWGLCISRADGVRVVRVINAHLDLFEHVTRQHRFKDDYLFYRFKR